ncbi:MAG: FixH family protein [Henriciella sp.]|jgi:nitrogen fixation protein FixH
MTDYAMTSETETSQKRLTGWHVLFIMLGFFGVVFAVNGVFLYHAITSFPGEDVKKSYVQGLNYNQTLNARAAEAALGWKAQMGVQDDALIVRLQDAKDMPLTGYTVIVEARRLTNDAEDHVLTLNAESEGTYSVATSELSEGQWRLKASVLNFNADETLFTAHKQVRIK